MYYANFNQQDRFNNSPFMEEDSHHKYNPTFTNRGLREKFLKQNIHLNTPDMNIGKEVLFDLYFDAFDQNVDESKSFLIATENPFINNLNIDFKHLKKYKKVFSWNDSISSVGNFKKLYVPNFFNFHQFTKFDERPYFSCLINANKNFDKDHYCNLYQERLNLIRWYEENAPNNFYLYGRGWYKPQRSRGFINSIIRRRDRLRTQLFGYKPFPSYCGEVKDKHEIYSRTKFSFCYENVSDLSDYITEKIFDSFFSGCVPVYWGADNILDHIPKNCFIDKRDFSSNYDLNKYLQSIDESEYSDYQENILNYLNSAQSQKFSLDNFLDVIVHTVINDLNLDS